MLRESEFEYFTQYISPQKSGWSFRDTDTFIYSNPQKFGVLPKHLEKPVDRIVKIHRIQIPFIKNWTRFFRSWPFGVCYSWPFQGLLVTSIWVIKGSRMEEAGNTLRRALRRKEGTLPPQQWNCPQSVGAKNQLSNRRAFDRSLPNPKIRFFCPQIIGGHHSNLLKGSRKFTQKGQQ